MDVRMLIVAITIAIAIVDLIVFVLLIRNFKNSKGLWQASLLFLLGFIYALGYGLELSAETLELKIVFNHIQYLAIPFIAVVWFFIAWRYESPKAKDFSLLALVTCLIPLMITILVFLFPNVNQTLYYTNAYIDVEGAASNYGFEVLVLEKGPFYYVAAWYNIFLLGLSALIYFRLFVKYKKGNHAEGGLVLGIISTILAIAVVPSLFSPKTYGIDYTLYFLLIVGYVVLYTMMKYEALDLKPTAHRATFEALEEPILILDDVNDIVSWNVGFEQAGFPPLQTHTPLEELFGDPEIVEAITTGKTVSFSGFGKNYILEPIPLQNQSGRSSGTIVRFNDMTQYVTRIETLNYEASHDELTRILNRRAFMERAEHYMKTKQNSQEMFAMVMMDIDDFKTVNDTYGHVIGDCVLEQLAVRISGYIPPEVIFCRYGGEEFLMMIPNTYHAGAEEMAEMIRRLIADRPFLVGDLQLNIKISLGIGFGSTGVPGMLRDFVDKADEAMYQSKRAGKNRVTSIR